MNTKGYREVQVYIKGSEHLPPPAEKIQNLMMYFVSNYNNDIEKIHHFEDGNGRIGRLLINYELIKNNRAPVVINEKDRVKYFELLNNNNVEGLAKWIEQLLKEEENEIKKKMNKMKMKMTKK